MALKWLMQNNLKESGYDKFLENLERFGCDYQKINIYPFLDNFYDEHVKSSELDTATPLNLKNLTNTIVIGSVSSARLAQEFNILPGGFLTENSDFDKWSIGFGLNNILNGDTISGKIFEILVPFEDNDIFVRPVKDDKSFSGMVISKVKFEEWRKSLQIIEADMSRLNRNTEISISKVKTILAEYRFFIIGGKIITHSMYKRGNEVRHVAEMDNDIYEFAQQMINLWTPSDGFVLDIASTPIGPKVIEINALGTAGYYACDVQKIIMALETFYDK